ncbi:MAG: NTP transferase domain-containing protein [Anaplasma sp.]
MDIIVLAAGDSSRMLSKIPKVLHKLGNAPMVEHVLQLANQLHPERVAIVANSLICDTVAMLAERHGLNFEIVIQPEAMGTGHATQLAILTTLQDSPKKHLLVLYGDTPLLRRTTADRMLEQLSDEFPIILAGFRSSDRQYGRIVADDAGKVLAVNPTYNADRLANSGVIACYRRVISELLHDIKPVNGELQLTDIVQHAATRGIGVGYIVADKREAIGINTREDLAAAEAYFQLHKRTQLLRSGVTLVAPEHVFLSMDTQIACGATIHPYVVFGPGAKVDSHAEIFSHSHLEFCHIMENALVGPFARIRGNSTINERCHVGNFVEVKECVLDAGSKVKHLCYLGNCHVGEGTNIGAGTVVCNYDGQSKQSSDVGDNCFVGANSTIVSPVNVGGYAVIAAGSVITDDLPPHSLGIARSKQTTRANYKQKRGEKTATNT